MTTRLAFQIATATLVGGIGGLWLGHEALSAASSNLVSALSIINAAIFPTVILSATVLKPANMSGVLVERYRIALKTQVAFFFGMLLFSLFTIAAILLAQTMNWRSPLTLPWQGWERKLDGIYNFAILFPLTFVAMRLPAFFRALMSLVNVHIDSVASEVSIREHQEGAVFKREVAEMQEIPTSGQHTRPFPVM